MITQTIVFCHMLIFMFAKNIVVGDELIGYESGVESVVSVRQVLSEKGVLNLLTSAEANKQHLVIANELVVGDLAWENWLLREINNIQVQLE